MLNDGKIQLNAYKKYYRVPENAIADSPEWADILNEVTKAQRLVLRDIFTNYKFQGFTYVYFIK
jgi:hypothetical protein